MIPLREAMLMVIFLSALAFVHTWAYEDERLMEKMALEVKVDYYSGLVAQCLEGRSDIIWTDPHTQVEMATQCRTVTMGRMQ